MRAAFFFTLGVAASACACVQAPWVQVPHGMLETPQTEIAAATGQFTIRAGERFRPPFYADDCLVTATVDNYRKAYQLGARKVRVTVPGRVEPLHGLLALCKVHPDATGPASREYLLQIPESYVQATSGGRVSVVYEETSAGQQFDDGFAHYDAWQLWLSETPFL